MIGLYRVTIPVDDLDRAARFYRMLFGESGERVALGWHYFPVGPVTLACHDAQLEDHERARPAAHGGPLYLAVDEPLVQVYARAEKAGARDLDRDIRTLPTGEHGFAFRDPFGNAFCRDFINAVKGGEYGRVKELLALDPDLLHGTDAAGVSALLLAAYKRHTRLAAFLLAMHEDLSVWEAAAFGQRDKLAAVLDAEAGLAGSYSVDGFTPLGLACFFGHPPCVELLLKRGADVRAPSRNAMRVQPLHSALSHAEETVALAIVDALLAAGADANAVQQGGYTPLHQAADRGSVALVQALLAAGADPRLRAENGRAPPDLARARGHAEVAQLLARAAAEKGPPPSPPAG
ncbi:MAG: ankyrin repeat domain-containing protein [Gammaproteobacteria bacterium]|nr:ankyrin repeat domain-containing protein [Gammaproteobacteria bacterium]